MQTCPKSGGGTAPPTFKSGGAVAPPAPPVLHHCPLLTILRCDEGELSAERTNAHRRDCSNDTDVGGVRSEGGDSEGGGGGGQLEALACPDYCHVDDVADDDSIEVIVRGRSPGHSG